jgi:hypothetical protein
MRKIALVSAKQFAPDEHFSRIQETADQLVAEPFRGVTSDGTIVPGLYPLGGVNDQVPVFGDFRSSRLVA